MRGVGDALHPIRRSIMSMAASLSAHPRLVATASVPARSLICFCWRLAAIKAHQHGAVSSLFHSQATLHFGGVKNGAGAKSPRHRAYMRPFARQSHGSPAQTQSLNKTRLPLVRQKPICILPFFKPFSSDLRARLTSNRIAKTRKKVRPSLTRGLGVRLAVERG